MGRGPSVFEAIGASRRRATCEYLAATDDDTVTLQEVATHVVTTEQDERDGHVADEAAERRVLVALHHQHLPKLADAGVVAYDHERKLVRAGPNLALANDLIRTWRSRIEDPDSTARDRAVGRR